VTKVPITVNGAQKLRDEFQRLKKEDRPRIVSAIAEARAHGDLRENAEYHAAKEEQGLSKLGSSKSTVCFRMPKLSMSRR
jgi:transcription elongation factor GreA